MSWLMSWPLCRFRFSRRPGSPNRSHCRLASWRRDRLCLEQLEDRHMLAILGLDITLNGGPPTDPVQVDDTFVVRVLAQDFVDPLVSGDASAGVIALPLDLSWDSAVIRYADPPPPLFRDPIPLDNPIVTENFPTQRFVDAFDVSRGADNLRGGTIPAIDGGAPIGQDDWGEFSLLRFQAVGAAKAMPLPIELVGSMSFADADPLTGLRLLNGEINRDLPPPPFEVIPRIRVQAVVQGQKFEDLDRDGIKDPSEERLSGWEIRAYLDENGDGRLQQGEFNAGPADSATTDGGGSYSLALDTADPPVDDPAASGAPADYIIVEVLQGGWTQTFPGTPVLDESLNTGSETLGEFGHTITIAPGDGNTSDLEFGNVIESQIAGFKWNDLDRDGNWDAAEPGLEGWTIYLDLNGNDQPDLGEPSDTTDSNGAFSFTNLLPDTYTVREVLQDGWEQTFPVASGEHVVTVPADVIGESGQTEPPNFGNWKIPPPEEGVSSLSGFVYADTDNDGVRKVDENGAPLELPLPNVTITLSRDGQTISTTTTGPDGWYDFEGLEPGTYELVETQPECFLDGKETLGIVLPGKESRGSVGNDRFFDIDLTADEHGIDYNFGELGVRAACINKRMFVASLSPRETVWPLLGVTPRVVRGTDGADTIRVQTDGEVIEVTVNDQEPQQFPLTAEVDIVSIDGLGGRDTVTLAGTEADEVAHMLPSYATLRDSSYAVEVLNAEVVIADAGTGDDLAVMRDSPGSDRLEAGGDTATLTRTDMDLIARAIGFATVRAISESGGDDTAERASVVDFLLELVGDWREL